MAAPQLEAVVMVESLRVVELRSLLSTMGKDKKGLKKDLVQRTTELIRNNFHPELFTAIQQLYERRHSAGSANSKRAHVVTPSTAAKVVADYPKKSCEPIHNPEEHMIQLPFYQILETIVAPIPLVATFPTRQQSYYFILSLSSRQLAQIKSCQTKAGVPSVQVVLRICYMESVGVEDDQYPPNIAVFVNGHACPVEAHYSSKKGLEPSRPCRPINLSPFVKTTTNPVVISWENFGKFYCVGVYLVKVFSSVELLAQLQTNSVEYCKQEIYKKLDCNPNNEIKTTRLQVSLICPLAKTRMSVPCRAQTCAHLQCFDAAFYLQMNERKPKWTCPVCHKPALFDSLKINGLLSGILQCTEETMKEIEYLSDGSWRPVSKDKECSKTTEHSSLSYKTSPVVDVVDLTQSLSDSDDDDGEALKTEEILTFTKGKGTLLRTQHS